MGTLLQDARGSVRSLAATPGLAAVAILTLSLGIGTSTALFSVIRGAILEPWPYHGYDRIVTIRGVFPKVGSEVATLSTPDYREIAAETRVFEGVIAGTARNVNLSEGGHAERVRGAALTANVFPLIRTPPLAGRVFSSADDRPGGPRVVVMSEGLWRRRFGGDPGVVGRAVRISGEPWTVVGIMPQRFRWWDCDLWFPLILDAASEDRQSRNLYVQGWLRPGVGLAAAEAALDRTARRVEREHAAAIPEYTGWRVALRPLVDDVLRDVRHALWVLLAAVALLLTIACANVAGLLLARAADRRHELALRCALGATRGRIARHLVAESLLLSAASCAIGLAFARAALDGILSLIPYGYIPAEAVVRLDAGAAAFAALISAVAGTASGLVPALAATREDLSTSLHESGRTSSGGRAARRTRDALIAFQIGIAVLLVSGAGLAVQGLGRLLRSPLGFTAAGVLSLRTDLPIDRYPGAAAVRAFEQNALARLRTIPGVTSAAAATLPPLTGAPSLPFELEGRSAADVGGALDAVVLIASDAYFETLRAPLVAGRTFDRRDSESSGPVAVVNAAMARKVWGTASPIGRRVRSGGPAAPWRTVVGVVGDVAQEEAGRATPPALYLPLAQEADPPRNLGFLLRSERTAAGVADDARARIAGLDPEIPLFRVQTLDAILRDSLGGKRLAVVLMGTFAASALLLSAIGLAGGVAFSVARRRREIGVRVALGARPADVRSLFLREALPVFGTGAFAGVLAAVSLAGILRSTLEWMPRAEPLLLGAVVALLAAVMGAATLVPVRRAARIDPASVLAPD